MEKPTVSFFAAAKAATLPPKKAASATDKVATQARYRFARAIDLKLLGVAVEPADEIDRDGIAAFHFRNMTSLQRPGNSSLSWRGDPANHFLVAQGSASADSNPRSNGPSPTLNQPNLSHRV